MSNTTINNAVLDIFGNLTGVKANVDVVSATGQVNVVGNVVAPRFVGNGSFLTGVVGTVAAGPRFRMFRSNNLQLLTTSTTTGANIAYDGIAFDTHSACNVSTGSFTAPQSGYYKFVTSTSFNNGMQGSGTTEIRLVKNTTQPIAILNGIFSYTAQPITNRVTYPGMALVNLAAGDIINVRGFNQAGVTQTFFGNASNNFTTFAGFYIGA
jgi:hypothetical protein